MGIGALRAVQLCLNLHSPQLPLNFCLFTIYPHYPLTPLPRRPLSLTLLLALALSLLTLHLRPFFPLSPSLHANNYRLKFKFIFFHLFVESSLKISHKPLLPPLPQKPVARSLPRSLQIFTVNFHPKNSPPRMWQFKCKEKVA